MIWNIICAVAIVYTIVDVSISLYVVRRIGLDAARARIRSLFGGL